MEPISSPVTHVKAQLAAGMPTDPFGLAYMQLCGVSYELAANIPAMVADPNRVRPWGEGSWKCVWGPAVDPLGANLAYVAAYYDSGLPVAAVVVLRGTDITDNGWGDFWQLFEDLLVTSQWTLPWLPVTSAPKIAFGTLDALLTIESLTDAANVSLQQFLQGFLADPANQDPVLVVTGHSLGGCLATVVAPWLRVTLAAGGVTVPIVPATFAAPTAGNAAFTAYFAASFPYAPRYYNKLDMVPYGWSDLAGVKTLYAPYGPPTPGSVNNAIDVFINDLKKAGASYAQPGCTGPLNGVICPGFDWYQQVGAQHDHRTYIALMDGVAPTCYTSLTRNRHYTPEQWAAGLGRVQEELAVPLAATPPLAG